MFAGSILVSDDIDAETEKAVETGLTRFNEKHAGPDLTKPLWVTYRDGDGKISGGLKGFVQGVWFAVAVLWVREDCRGQGIGSGLLAKAEDSARSRACAKCWLATTTFQAPRFYEKRGYVEIFRLPDLPPGHAFIWMTKTL